MNLLPFTACFTSATVITPPPVWFNQIHQVGFTRRGSPPSRPGGIFFLTGHIGRTRQIAWTTWSRSLMSWSPFIIDIKTGFSHWIWKTNSEAAKKVSRSEMPFGSHPKSCGCEALRWVREVPISHGTPRFRVWINIISWYPTTSGRPARTGMSD